ncbi:protein TASOR isoform X2 [Electrophorus electricus]|uniref:protein TASOR isoform X2 n=1 Tax=Electrophorus electricus TaxID=8005 RepID=UPI0015CF8B3D|nr:protein TASOR isoform X2 [Electrophorus electricus]
MACNFNEDRKFEKDSIRPGGSALDGGDSQKQLPACTTTTSKQNGDQAGCEDEQMSEQDASERRRSGLSDLKHCGSSPSTLQRSAEELPRRNFQIPRKIKERKGLLQQLAPDSREFEELVKLLSSFYLDTSSRGAFTYTKACLVHSELLEKEFIGKKRELKQAGRTDTELTDSYAFLLPDANKTHWICEKGLSVGHARLSNLGNPVKGVYLSKYSDLLQINPFEVGASGDVIIFKVMKGRLKSIFENMPKSNLEPSPKFDCHIHKNASKVTSLLSYRAFELTQQYFYEFAFEEPKSRPRHVCPYAVVSFQYKGKESAAAAHRLSSTLYEGHRVRRRYTVWSGPLVNRGEELYQVCIRSPSLPFLPLKLPDRIDISAAMHLDQVKRKIPSTLLSWETYSGTQEVHKCGIYGSLFEVMGKTKQGNCLSGLLHRLEREKMVLVKPLVDRGFLFLLSPAHMHGSNERRGRNDRGLQALFVFQEPRITRCFMSKHAGPQEDNLVSLEPKDPVTDHLDTYVPALHHAFVKLRSNPPKDLAAGVKSQVQDYLGLRQQGVGRPFAAPEYRHNLDERPSLHPPPRAKGVDSALSTYLYGPAGFQLPVARLRQGTGESCWGTSSPPAGGEEYSPVSDWGGPDGPAGSGARPGLAQSNGGGQGARLGQAEYDKDKMEKLLKLIQLHKRALGKEDGSGQERADTWDPAGLKRRSEGDALPGVSKYLKTGAPSNGEPGRVPQGDKPLSLSAVMDSMGLCDTDLRERVAHGASVQDTQALLKLFFSAIKKIAQSPGPAAATSALAPQPQDGPGPEPAREPGEHAARSDLRSRHAEEEQTVQEYLEDQMACSISSMDLCSPSSNVEQQAVRPVEHAGHTPSQQRAVSTGPDAAGDAGTSGSDRPTPVAGRAVESILDQEFQHLCMDIRELMDTQKIYYVSQPPSPRQEGEPNRLSSAFSAYVSKYIQPVPVQGYISTLCEWMSRMSGSSSVPPRPAPSSPAPAPQPVPAPAVVPPVQPAPAPPVSPSTVTTPPHAAVAPTPLHARQPAPKPKPQEAVPKVAPPAPQSPCPAPTPAPPSAPTHTPTPAPKKQSSPTCKRRLGTIKEAHLVPVGKKTDGPKVPGVVDSPKGLPPAGSTGLPPIAELPPDPAQAGGAGPVGNNVIGQLKPDVLCTLVEIMQMNAVKFYIQRGDEEESRLCTEIKGYLESLGNIECDPQTYLENNCQQKFMVIIQNEDIASHVHKIPALVSLKKLSTVYFAGVDSLDDVKNRTYNELFVSGGLIVSDELILKPDFITLGKLQAFLQFLEGQSTAWKWKVHCKTQKKLKELSRLNSEALDLLNLLTAYQKKHLVEFLPYHECDAPVRQAPDLDCLVKLQAQHTQLRHVIFLTDKCFEPPKFSSNGVITAGINDIMTNFESLVSSTKTNMPTLPAPPTAGSTRSPTHTLAVEPDVCVEEEDMSLDSDEEASAVPEGGAEKAKTPLPPPPRCEEFRPPLPDLSGRDPLSSFPGRSQSSYPVDYNALKTAISQYKASRQGGAPTAEVDDGLTSFGVNPHQSYLYPSTAQWSPYPASPGYHVASAYSSPACSASQGPEYAQLGTPTVNQTGTPPLSLPPALPQANPSTLIPTIPSTQPPPNPATLAPANPSAPPVPQVSGGAADALPALEAPPCPQPSAQAPPLPGDSAAVASGGAVGHVAPSGSQDVQGKAMESAPLASPSSSSSSSLPGTLPGFPDPPVFPALTPIPPVPPMFNWAAAQHGYAPGVSVGHFSTLPPAQSEAAGKPAAPGSADGPWAAPGEGSTPGGQAEGGTAVAAPGPAPFQEAGSEKSGTPGNLTPSSQGSRTPVNSCAENKGGGLSQAQAGGAAPGRGGAGCRALLPLPGAGMGPACRGGLQGPAPRCGGGGTFGPRGPMDIMRGCYRGRGVPPVPMRSRPGRGPMRGGSVCNWGYPPGRGAVPDYYSDYTYP